MSKSHFVQLDAIAFQLVAALEQYGQDVQTLVRQWHAEQDMELYAVVSRQVDDIRNYSAALPKVAAQWLTVLISHTELMHGLLRVWRPGEDRMQLEEQLRDHLDAVAAFRAKARRMILSPREVRLPS